MTTAEIMDALRRRYPPEAYAFLEEVRNAAGFDASRSCDAVAMSLWPCNGLQLHGFEVKASRGDWLRELKTPEKAAALLPFFDRWWLVLGDPTIAKTEEVPDSWGILVLYGGRLHLARPAAKLDAVPVSRGFLAALLRRATITRAELFELHRERLRGAAV